MNFPSVGDLIQFLERERGNDEFLFRGQVTRYPRHRWTTSEKTDHDIEALYPADFRFFYHEHEPTDSLARMVSAARAYNRELRDLFSKALVFHLLTSDEKDDWVASMVASYADTIAKKQSVFESAFRRMAWSLAQHYGIATALTDLTFTPRVAGWFATSPWEPHGPLPAPGSQGVVYCFNRRRCEDVLKAATIATRALGANDFPQLFLVDIRDVPATVAKRPRAQCGASLYGFDQPLVIEMAFVHGAVEVFEFTHTAGEQVGIQRSDVVPESDPLQPLVDRFLAIRAALKPAVAGTEPVPADRIGPAEALERLQTVLRVPITSAHTVESFPLTDRYTAFLFDQIESAGSIHYKYLLPVFDARNRAIACVISVEESAATRGLDPKVLQAVGLGGGEFMGMWSSHGHATIEIGSWPDAASFRQKAVAVAERVLRLSDVAAQQAPQH